MTDISNSEYAFKGNKRQRSRVIQAAEYLAQARGGEIKDHIREAERLMSPEPFDENELAADDFKLAATYPYTDGDGLLIYEVRRYEHERVTGAKEFRQCRPLKRGSTLRVAGAGLLRVPYRWPELINRPDEVVYWCEGEKDADRLLSQGLLATTSAGQHWSTTIAKALTGRHVVILEDNDDKGREHAAKAEAKLRGFAASTKRIALPGLPPTGDISDWLDAGHTIDELRQIVDGTKPSGVRASPAGWFDPKTLPRRQWLYPPHYIRQFVSLLVATGGVGKSSLVIAEALAMVTGQDLLGVRPDKPLRIWLWNGEDPLDELRRRVAAVCSLYKLTEADIGARLFLDSGREMPFAIAAEDGRKIQVDEALIAQLIATIRANQIDALIIDPFVASHRVSENDNAAIERVAKAWARIADEANCSVMLVHHSRKANGGDGLTVQDARGASALHDAARSARVLIPMTKEEAKGAQIEERDRRSYFRADNGKSNLAPPPEGADWFKLIRVNLENGPGFEVPGDNVGVVSPWSYPRADLPHITPLMIIAAQDAIRAGGPWPKDQRAEPWVGRPIAKAVGRDADRPADRKAIAKLIKDWVASGWLKEVEGRNRKREMKKFIEAGKAPAVVHTTTARQGAPE